MIDRRTLLAAAVGGLPALARAETTPPRIVSKSMFAGALAGNILALGFSAPDPPLRPPADLVLIGEAGARRWGELKGKIHLVPLWAEWCAPCLGEARDLADLLARHGGDAFGIVSMMTGSHQKLDYPNARATLARAQAGGLPLWIEPQGGDRLYQSLAVWPAIGRPTLPCTLLVDRAGRIRGRMFGAPLASSAPLAPGPREISAEQKAKLAAGEVRSAWATPAADAFVKALLAGALG